MHDAERFFLAGILNPKLLCRNQLCSFSGDFRYAAYAHLCTADEGGRRSEWANHFTFCSTLDRGGTADMQKIEHWFKLLSRRRLQRS